MDSVRANTVLFPVGRLHPDRAAYLFFDAAGYHSEILHLLPSGLLAYQERHKGSYVVATLAAASLSSSGRVGSRGGTEYSA